MVNGGLMRRYYYGMQPLLGRVRYSDSHMRNDLSASFLRPQHCRMGRAKRNPSLLTQTRRAPVARDYGSVIRLRADNWLVAIRPFVARTAERYAGC